MKSLLRITLNNLVMWIRFLELFTHTLRIVFGVVTRIVLGVRQVVNAGLKIDAQYSRKTRFSDGRLI